MMKNVLRSMVVSLALCACVASAQNHSTGLVFATGAGNPVAFGTYNVGSLNTIIPAGALGSTVVLYRGTMDIDNTSFAVPYIDLQSGSGILQIDRQQNRTSLVLSTLAIFGPQVRQVRLNETGGYDALMTGGLFGSPGICRVNRVGGITTFVSSNAINSPLAFVRDVDTGDYFIWDAGGLFTPDRIHRVTADGSSITSIIQLPATIAISSFDIEIDQATGDLYASSTRGVQRIDQLGGASRVVSGGPFGSTGPMFMDRTSASRPRLIAAVGSVNPNPTSLLYSVDINTFSVTTISTTTLLTPITDAFVDRSSNVVSIRRGPSLWEISINIPGEGNKPFAAPLGISGTRPGFLVGPRRIALNPDVFTFLSVNNLMGPIYRGGVGRLDNLGRAVARLNLTGIPGLSGLRVYVVAAAVDPTAPNGLSVITDPISFQL